MLDSVSIFTTDKVWKNILENFGARIVADKNLADVDFDALDFTTPIGGDELKAKILDVAEKNQKKIINSVFGRPVAIPQLQMQIIVLLARTGGMSAADIKKVIGFAPDATTHAIDTAIYNLRRVYGRDFIKLKNGRYEL